MAGGGAVDRLDRVAVLADPAFGRDLGGDRKSTRLNSSHTVISYAVFCLKKKTRLEMASKMKRTTRTSSSGPTTTLRSVTLPVSGSKLRMQRSPDGQRQPHHQRSLTRRGS